MSFDRRRLAVATAGFCAFVNLYSPQALLPQLSREFGVGAAEISTIMTASTLAIALTAPFTGAVADVLGRKRVIVAAMFLIVVPTLLMAFAPNVPAMVVWRFVQGLVLPPIFAVTVAYIGDEWPPAEVAGVAGIYIAGSSIGGFAGRFMPGIVGRPGRLARRLLRLAAMTLVAASRSCSCCRARSASCAPKGFAASARQMLRHLRNPQLLATYAVGFGVLFNFIATFTYVSFHLAGAALQFFSDAGSARIFVTYLVGTVMPAVDRLGDGAVRAAPFHARRHRGLDRRRAADAGAAGRR